MMHMGLRSLLFSHCAKDFAEREQLAQGYRTSFMAERGFKGFPDLSQALCTTLAGSQVRETKPGCHIS